MVKEKDLSRLLETFSNKLQKSWQTAFLPGVLLYGASLVHFFYFQPTLNPSLKEYLKNIDLASFIIAIILTIIIFNLKRKYFSRKFSRYIIEQQFQKSEDIDHETLLKKIFMILQGKMTLVWISGFLLIINGVLFYWLTFSAGNMHLYFMVGAFSQLTNYPRKDLFFELPWYVIEEKKNQIKKTKKIESGKNIS